MGEREGKEERSECAVRRPDACSGVPATATPPAPSDTACLYAFLMRFLALNICKNIRDAYCNSHNFYNFFEKKKNLIIQFYSTAPLDTVCLHAFLMHFIVSNL